MRAGLSGMFAILIAAGATAAEAPQACLARSGAQTPHLVELYTSEGCSSCPPAEAWIGSVDAERTLALAFHVDYWDDLGWRDTFARPEFTARQQRAAARGGSGIVYTPELLLDGREWRGWGSGALPAPGPAPYALSLRVEPGETLRAQLDGVPAQAPLTVQFALIEEGLVRRIERGENAGRTLREPHIVRAVAGPLAPAAAQAQWTPPAGAVRAQLSVVAWLSDADGRVLQALQRPLQGCD